MLIINLAEGFGACAPQSPLWGAPAARDAPDATPSAGPTPNHPSPLKDLLLAREARQVRSRKNWSAADWKSPPARQADGCYLATLRRRDRWHDCLRSLPDSPLWPVVPPGGSTAIASFAATPARCAPGAGFRNLPATGSVLIRVLSNRPLPYRRASNLGHR
jgi:hypothetical protein